MGLAQQPLAILFLFGAHPLVQLVQQIGVRHIHQLLFEIVIAGETFELKISPAM